MATEMAEVSNRVNFGGWVGCLTCPEKSGQHEYPMISGLVRKKRYGIQCPENIGPASTWWLRFSSRLRFRARARNPVGPRPESQKRQLKSFVLMGDNERISQFYWNNVNIVHHFVLFSISINHLLLLLTTTVRIFPFPSLLFPYFLFKHDSADASHSLSTPKVNSWTQGWLVVWPEASYAIQSKRRRHLWSHIRSICHRVAPKSKHWRVDKHFTHQLDQSLTIYEGISLPCDCLQVHVQFLMQGVTTGWGICGT